MKYIRTLKKKIKKNTSITLITINEQILILQFGVLKTSEHYNNSLNWTKQKIPSDKSNASQAYKNSNCYFVRRQRQWDHKSRGILLIKPFQENPLSLLAI